MVEVRDRAGAKLEQLRRAVDGLRTRGPVTGWDRYLLIAGAVLLPLGLLVVLMGWYGASKTPYTFEQIPYLISGGLLGVGLLFAGGFLYFGYWLTRLIAENRERDRVFATLLERLESPSAPAVIDAPPSSANGKLLATAKGTLLHRPDCPIVAGKSKLRKISPGTAGFKPCKLCNPEA